MRSRELALALAIGALGLTLALQGWRSRPPDVENTVPYIDGARRWLDERRAPDHGTVTGFGTYAPPGASWIVLPGLLIFDDDRLFDAPGKVALYLGTLLGIFLLARACLGPSCALLAVFLYGLSDRGLVFAAAAPARGHPFFYVWMAYCTCWWVARRDARYLAAALIIWAAGMYVFMEIAPAILIPAVVWLCYRPPVTLRAVAVPAAVALIIWFPYFRFEAARGFGDLRSQVLLQPNESRAAADVDPACESNPPLRRTVGADGLARVEGHEEGRPVGRLAIALGKRGLAVASGFVANFHGAIPGQELALLALLVAGALTILHTRGAPSGPGPARFHRLLNVLAIGLLGGVGVLNEFVIRRLLPDTVSFGPPAVAAVRTVQSILALGAVALLARRPIVRACAAMAGRRASAPCNATVLLLALVIPWGVVLWLQEWGRDDRLVWVWPLQAIVIAFAMVTAVPRAGAARVAGCGLVMLVASFVVINPSVWLPIRDWRLVGWSGADADEIRVADYLGQAIRASGSTRAAIGYQLYVAGPLRAPWKAVDARWRDGSPFEVRLESRWGVRNLNQCSAGLSARDEYRIVDVHPPPPDAPFYFDIPPASTPTLVARFHNYEVYRIDPRQ